MTEIGQQVVYKCTIPHAEAIGEADALVAYGGNGAVRVIESHAPTFELLIERCHPGTSLWGISDDRERDEVASGLMHRLWIDAPDGPYTTLEAMTAQWAATTQRRLITSDLPWVADPIERGADLLRSLPLSTPDRSLLHQDLHPGNILSAGREPWLVIDPKPVVGDPAFDPIQLLVQRDGRIVEPDDPAGVARRLSAIADLVGLDAERIGLWGVARCAEWSMWSWEHGNTIDAAIEYSWARTLDALVPA
jgi:streptomycin 6-kinase